MISYIGHFSDIVSKCEIWVAGKVVVSVNRMDGTDIQDIESLRGDLFVGKMSGYGPTTAGVIYKHNSGEYRLLLGCMNLPAENQQALCEHMKEHEIDNCKDILEYFSV